MLDWEQVLYHANTTNLTPPKKVVKSNSEWQAVLTKNQFLVTRAKGTEPPFSGEYCETHEAGKYACVCCQTLLFDATQKFDSQTGWPSFTLPVQNNVIAYVADHSYGMQRVEVVCNVCDAHLGHVFPDGPLVSGLRYCINSVALVKLEE